MKRSIILLPLLICLLILSGCGKSGASNKDYKKYVLAYLDANYKGDVSSYAKLTGSEKDALYDSYKDGMGTLASSLAGYYGINIPSDNKELRDKYIDITKRIYEKADYEVKEADGEGAVVEVVVRPIKLLPDTEAEVIALTESFNARKNNGEFDDYGTGKYESEFAEGVLAIIEAKLDSLSYGDQASVKVEITGGDGNYSLNGEDLKKLDALFITAD